MVFQTYPLFELDSLFFFSIITIYIVWCTTTNQKRYIRNQVINYGPNFSVCVFCGLKVSVE